MGSAGTISGMRLYITRPTLFDYSDRDRKQLLASLTLQQPNITRVSNAMSIDGQLGSRGATLRLEIFQGKDCSAEYTCEVLFLDAQRKEVLSSNRVKQREPHRNGIEFAAEPSQVMLFVQQLSLLENRMEDRLRAIEEKIESRVADKLCQLEAKLSALSISAGVEIRDKSCPSDKLLKEQEETLQHTLEVSERIERSMNDSYAMVSSVERYLRQLQVADTTHGRPLNLTGEAHEVFSNISLCLGRHTTPGGLQALLEGFNQLGLLSCNNSTDLLSSIHDEITDTNTMISNTIKPVSDLLQPKQCRKGSVSLALQTPFPYPVIRPNEDSGLNVSYLCDQTTDGGGWIVIQRRTTGEEDFYRDWATYKKGFGSLAGDFWIGNDNLHALTSKGIYELRVELKDKEKSAFANYDKFSVGSEEEDYALELGHYTSGTAGDSLVYHRGKPFSTFDRDNGRDSRNCAKLFLGAWWYDSCLSSNLNGKWAATGNRGPSWHKFTNNRPVTHSEMKIRLLDTL